MSAPIDERLRRDAREIDAVGLSDEAQRALTRRLEATRQVAAAPQRPARPTWLPAAAAALLLVTVAIVLYWPTGKRPVTPAVAVTVPQQAPAPRHGVSTAGALRERIPLQRVSQTAPLEAEWVAIQEDLERARERIERDIPVRF